MDHKIVAARTEMAQRRIEDAARRLAAVLEVENALDLQHVHSRYPNVAALTRLEAVADYLELLAARTEPTVAAQKQAKRGKAGI